MLELAGDREEGVMGIMQRARKQKRKSQGKFSGETKLSINTWKESTQRAKLNEAQKLRKEADQSVMNKFVVLLLIVYLIYL